MSHIRARLPQRVDQGIPTKEESMDERDETLRLVKTCFAHQDALIDRALRHGTGFRSLCEDYEACSEALARWKRSDSPLAPGRRQEYAELLVVLDREIQAWLDRLSETAHQEER